MDMSNQPPVRGTAVRLEGADMTLGYDDCPEPGIVLASRVERAKNAVLAFDAAVAAIKKDPNLSPRGREDALQKLEPERAKVADLVDKVDEDALMLERLATALEASVYEVPALEPSEVIADNTDREIRQWYAALPDDQRQRQLSEVTSGRNPRHALALARSPVPTIEQQMGLAALRANLPQEDHATLQGVATRMATLSWARGATGMMRRGIARKNGGSTA